MIKPIPKKLLPHNCEYEKYLGNLGEGETFEEVVGLLSVKVEEKQQFKVTSNGREMVGNARLFYDCVNSSGLSEKPYNGDLLTFNGHKYMVVECEVYYGTQEKPHHYEILLK